MEQKLTPEQVAARPVAAPPKRASIWQLLIRTPQDWTALILRVTLGAVMFPHGAQKVFGWFGGHGIQGTVGYFHQNLGIPPVLGYLDIAAEFLGAIALVLGFLGRLSALGVAVVMVVAVSLVHARQGFFLPGGFEYHLLVLAMTIAIMIRGSGALSIDRAMSAKKV